MNIPSATLAKDYEHVYSMDDALDRGFPAEPPDDPQKREDWKVQFTKWRERWSKAIEENKLGDLPILAGQKPIIWKLRHLRGAAEQHVRQHMKAHAISEVEPGVKTVYLACQMALYEVADAVRPDGTEYRLPVGVSSITGFPEVPEATMQQLAQIDRNDLIYELGLRALTQLFLSEKS